MPKLTPQDFLNGQLLLINKPLTWTSFDAVNKVRYVLRKYTGNKKIKVGHAGTLDPLATGLLLICTGKFTKRIDEFQGMPKSYIATIKLGEETPSYDLETEVFAQHDISSLTLESVESAMKTFVGDIQQIPPIFSAIKIEGRRMYDIAREGEIFIPEARAVSITNFSLIENRWPEIVAQIDCSKGTYIRSLAHDLGRAVNSGAHLSALVRSAIGKYKNEDAILVDDFVAEYNI